jgi:hypothetical protein
MNISVFLSHGTLLGWYRECNFIAHTHDVDLGVPYEHIQYKTDKMIQQMKNAGFKYIGAHGTLEQGYEMKFLKHVGTSY